MFVRSNTCRADPTSHLAQFARHLTIGLAHIVQMYTSMTSITSSNPNPSSLIADIVTLPEPSGTSNAPEVGSLDNANFTGFQDGLDASTASGGRPGGAFEVALGLPRMPWEPSEAETRILNLAEGQLDVIQEGVPHHLPDVDWSKVRVENGNLPDGVLGTFGTNAFNGNTKISVDGDQIAAYASRHSDVSERDVVKTVMMDELAGLQLSQDRNFRTPQNREALAAVAAVLMAGTQNTNLGDQVRQRVREAGVGSVQAELELNRDNALFSATPGFYERVNGFLNSVQQ